MTGELTFFNQKYLLQPAGETRKIALSLTQRMLADGHTFDRIIALAKGGIVFARYLTDYLGKNTMYFITLQSYVGIGEATDTIAVRQGPLESFKGEHVLVIDDLCDRGSTMQKALEQVKEGDPRKITTATLCVKPWTTYKPDYAGYETDAWVIFPWEHRETITILKNKWTNEGVENSEQLHAFAHMGFSPEEIELCK